MTDINSLENELKEEFEMFSIEILRSDVMDKRKMSCLDEWLADLSCSIQQSSCYTCYTEDSCRPAIIDSCQKQLS